MVILYSTVAYHTYLAARCYCINAAGFRIGSYEKKQEGATNNY